MRVPFDLPCDLACHRRDAARWSEATARRIWPPKSADLPSNTYGIEPHNSIEPHKAKAKPSLLVCTSQATPPCPRRAASPPERSKARAGEAEERTRTTLKVLFGSEAKRLKKKELETAACHQPQRHPRHDADLRQTNMMRCEVVRNIGEAARQQQILPEISQATPGDP